MKANRAVSESSLTGIRQVIDYADLHARPRNRSKLLVELPDVPNGMQKVATGRLQTQLIRISPVRWRLGQLKMTYFLFRCFPSALPGLSSPRLPSEAHHLSRLHFSLLSVQTVFSGIDLYLKIISNIKTNFRFIWFLRRFPDRFLQTKTLFRSVPLRSPKTFSFFA